MPPDERLAFSMGAVDLPADVEIDAAPREADEALYRAKAAGGDRLETGPTRRAPEPEQPTAALQSLTGAAPRFRFAPCARLVLVTTHRACVV